MDLLSRSAAPRILFRLGFLLTPRLSASHIKVEATHDALLSLIHFISGEKLIPTPYTKRLNPFITRMAEDMQLRNFSPCTIDSYTYQVDKFCRYFGQPADQLGPDEIREYQLYLVNEKKVSWSAFNQAVCGLRFLYEVSLDKPWAVKHIPFGKRPKKLPIVLSDQEACRLIECTENPKHRAVLLTCYAAGLRLSEATHLKIADIDGQRNQLRISEGKGRKDRVVPASPRLLEALRKYWKLRRPPNYLFPGKTPDVPCCTRETKSWTIIHTFMRSSRVEVLRWKTDDGSRADIRHSVAAVSRSWSTTCSWGTRFATSS